MRNNRREDFAELVRANQQKASFELRTTFDYIVVGAGTSGSVVAGRLAPKAPQQQRGTRNRCSKPSIYRRQGHPAPKVFRG